MALNRFASSEWKYWLLTHKYLGDTLGEDAFFCTALAGMGASCFNGAIHGYFSTGSFFGMLRHAGLYTLANFGISYIPNCFMFNFGLLVQDHDFIQAAVFATPALSNLGGVLSSQIIGYDLSSLTANFAINILGSNAPNNLLTVLEAATLSAWAGYHLFRVINRNNINTLEETYQRKIKEGIIKKTI